MLASPNHPEIPLQYKERLLNYDVLLFYPGAETLQLEKELRSSEALAALSRKRGRVLTAFGDILHTQGQSTDREAALVKRIGELTGELEELRRERANVDGLSSRLAREATLLKSKTAAAILFHVCVTGWVASGEDGKDEGGDGGKSVARDGRGGGGGEKRNSSSWW